MATAATGVDATNGLSYIGNDDYRGYLNYLAQNGNQNAGALLGFVGNDGKFQNGSTFMAPLSGDINNLNSSSLSAWNTPVKGTGAGSGTTTSGTTTSGPSIADSIAALNDANSQDDAQYNSTEAALQNGLTQIGDDYNKNVSRANEDQNTAHTNYDKQRTQNTTDRQTAQDAIYANGNTLAQSVRRIFGLASGANSSAYQIAAPGAIAKDMTVKTADNAANFKKNYDAIDNAQNETDTSFGRFLQDLADQRKQKESGLRGGILQQEQSILADKANNQAKIAQLNGGTYADGKAAAAATTAAAQARQSAIDGLFAQFRTPYNVTAVTPTAATTDQYTPTKSTVATNGAQPTVDESPYAAALKKIFGQGATPTTAGAPVAA